MPEQTGFWAWLARWNDQVGKRPGLAGGVLFALTALVFQGVLGGAFNFDDIPLILENPYVTKPGHWRLLFFGSIWSFRGPTEPSHFYRPLQFFVYGLLYRLVGSNPAVFHLVQLCVYGAAVCMVFSLGRKLLRNNVAAFVGALLWALHPLHVETVAWISDLGDVCSGLLVVLAFSLFLEAESGSVRPPARHALSACVYFSALLFKELALSFPLLILVYGFFLGGKESWSSRAWRWLPYVLATVAYAALRVSALGRFSTAPQSYKLSLRTVAAAIGLLGQHAKLFVWPLHLSLARDFVLSASLRSPWPWLTLLALLAAFTLGRQQPVLGFVVAWWGITLLPSLDIRQLVGYPVADRFSYLPSVGLCLGIAFGALVLLPQRMPRFNRLQVLPPILLVVGSLWTLQDIRSIPSWHDEDTLWRHAAAATPDSALAHMFHAMSLEFEKGDLDGAAREYQTALRLNQTSFRPIPGTSYGADLGLGRIALRKGHIQEAVHSFAAAIRVDPMQAAAYRELGTLYFPEGDYASSAQYFIRAVQVDPRDVQARFFLGTCWMKLGKLAQAAEEFHMAREVDPTYSQAYLAEAAALDAAGDKSGAARVRGEMPSK
ncbi:MAG: tetratricopeptide repeat protein [Terriglobia bacterium]